MLDLSNRRPLGAHMSIAGGCANAVDRAARVEATALQMFTRNQLRWHSPPADRADVRRFRRKVKGSQLRYVCAHAGYLINLASSDAEIRDKSVVALVDELQRADALGCASLVLHPGSPKEDSREIGIERVVDGFRQVIRQTGDQSVRIALENTAGQGNTLGSRLDDLVDILDGLDWHARVGVCLDSAHLFAAGVDLRDAACVRDFADELVDRIGLNRLLLLHLNDSQTACGSRCDRHHHIGHGLIGEKGIRNFLQDDHFRTIPAIIETPKANDSASMRFDRMNLELLRRLDSPLLM